MIRSFADGDETAAGANRSQPAPLLDTGQSRSISPPTSKSRCFRPAPWSCAHASVPRHRSSPSRALGAVVLIESDEAGPITLSLTVTALQRRSPRPCDRKFRQQSSAELQRLSGIAPGDDAMTTALGILNIEQRARRRAGVSARAPRARPESLRHQQLSGRRRRRPPHGARNSSALPVLFLETGYHFPETLAYRDRMAAEWDLNLVNVLPEHTVAEQESEFGILYQIRSRSLLRAAQSGAAFSLACALRHLGHRPAPPAVEVARQSAGGGNLHACPAARSLAKLSPLAEWTTRDVWQYAEAHDIPLLPLYEQGYTSIGCAPVHQPALRSQRSALRTLVRPQARMRHSHCRPSLSVGDRHGICLSAS